MSISGNPLAALGPISWDILDQHDLGHFLADTFTCAQILADSIPATSSSSAIPSTGRPRSQTDGAVSYGLHSAPVSHHGSGTATPSPEDMSAKAEKLRQDLRQSWKEVKTGGSNPRDIVVYKMNGGREGYAGSSWFARRSLHRIEKGKLPTASKTKDKKVLADVPDVEIGFDMFRKALLKEFSLPEQKKEGEASTVRTMITKKRLEHVVVDGQEHDAVDKVEAENVDGNVADAISRQLDVYLLEAEFPGPTATRDFVTMLLTTQSPCQTAGHDHRDHSLRQFMLVSKPCDHPETPQRSGYVRAQYESVEVIREVRVPAKPTMGLAKNIRKTRSSIDLSHGDVDTDASDLDTDGHDIAIEWLMITRNNPGGNVPRFLVDKSTPSSIISDANKFLDWLVAQQVEATMKEEVSKPEVQTVVAGAGPGKPVTATPLAAAIPEEEEEETGEKAVSVDEVSDTGFATEDTPENNNRSGASPSVTILSLESSGGAASSAKLFNMLSGALGGAGTAVASKLPNPFGGAVEALHSSFEDHPLGDEDDGIDTTDDTDNTYSDIDDEDEDGDKSRGRSRRSTQDETSVSTDKSAPDNASVASIPPPPPTTALEMLAHDRALALCKLNDRSSTGLSTGGSSVAASDVDNDTETGSATTSSKQQKKIEQEAAAKAAKAAKAAEAARKKHEKELQKLQDKQKKAEAEILKANKGKKDANPVEVVKEEEVGSSAQSTKSSKSTKSVTDSTTGAAAADHSSTSSLPDDPANTELQKLREKHDRAVARQKAQYQKEMEKLEKKRQQQAEKEAARLRKQQERDEKNDTARQLTHARAERDVARKEVQVLTERVRQLEAQNELLAAEVAQSTGKSKLHAKVEDAEDEK
ncbi:hypothetical protein Sste5346_009366 [Sporothrix stenoceras]|uniref:DUF3074 domain-containing protein n=1 Tax=Sporothrix stenoceras TaxID=5173 RepID=A0ABR3YL33_9PEZI